MAASCWHAIKINIHRTVLTLNIFVSMVKKQMAYILSADTVLTLCLFLATDQQPHLALSLLIMAV